MQGVTEIEVLSDDSNAPLSARGAATGAGILTFGDTVVRLSSEPAPSATMATATEGAPSRRAALRSDDRLCVVVQKGRLFQRAHPDIEVLLDHGSHLLVAVPPEQGGVIREQEHPCFSIQPAREGEVVYETVPRPANLEPASAEVTGKLDLLSLNTFTESVTALASLPTRFTTSSGYRAAIADCRTRLAGFGYEVVERAIQVPGLGASSNLVARRRGAEGPPSILVTAHLDSVNDAEGPTAPAPGADDNASGSAGVVTLAKALAAADADREVLFVLFGGEEQGCHGSKQFVTDARDFDATALTAVLNMDMIASVNRPAANGEATLEVMLEGAEVSRAVMEGLAVAAHRHTGLKVCRSFMPARSDHVSFIEQGLPAVLTIEGQDDSNERVHTPDDRLEFLDPELAMQILRMNMGYILEALD